jgi:biotin operon repressor
MRPGRKCVTHARNYARVDARTQLDKERRMAGKTYVGVLRDVLAIERLPDGSSMPAHLKHALLVLAVYWPKIWPSQTRLAREMGISERQLNRRLRELEDAGLISRSVKTGCTTRYRLILGAVMDPCHERPKLLTPTSDNVQQENDCEDESFLLGEYD